MLYLFLYYKGYNSLWVLKYFVLRLFLLIIILETRTLEMYESKTNLSRKSVRDSNIVFSHIWLFGVLLVHLFIVTDCCISRIIGLCICFVFHIFALWYWIKVLSYIYNSCYYTVRVSAFE